MFPPAPGKLERQVEQVPAPSHLRPSNNAGEEAITADTPATARKVWPSAPVATPSEAVIPARRPRLAADAAT